MILMKRANVSRRVSLFLEPASYGCTPSPSTFNHYGKVLNMVKLTCIPAIVFVALSSPQLAASDLEKNTVKSKQATVCAACHGANGVSVANHIPNLAGQRAAYLNDQLLAFNDGSRKSEIMNPIASQLSPEEIKNLSAYFAAQTASSGDGKSAFLPTIAKSRVEFPADYKRTFSRYHVLNMPEDSQVKHYYANDVALRAAAAGKSLPDGSILLVEIYSAKLDGNGKPLTGTDGYFVPDRLLSFPVSGRGPSWGEGFPEMLRNGDWNYALFGADKQLRSNANQAECLACHKPKVASNYAFTSSELKTARN